MRQNKTFKNGFTLIELIIALAVLGVLVAVGVPGMQTLLANMAVNSTANRLLNTFAYARSEALSRSANVSVCASNNGASCSTTDVNWGNGWIVINASDGDTVLRVESNEGNQTTISDGGTVNFNSRGENTDGTRDFVVESARSGISSKTVSVSQVGYASL